MTHTPGFSGVKRHGNPLSYRSLPKHDEDARASDLARGKVAVPAICLMILAACGALIGIVQAIGVMATFAVIAADKGLPGSHEALEVYGVFGGGALGGLLAVVVYALIFIGALSMKNLRRQGFAIAAGILALIPCFSPCFLLSLPLGIWVLAVLSSDDVKRAFH